MFPAVSSNASPQPSAPHDPQSRFCDVIARNPTDVASFSRKLPSSPPRRL